MIDRVGDDVARELARFGPASGFAPLLEAWPAAVGPEIARNAWPARLARDGTLHVHTSSAAWAFELGHLTDRIQASLGEHAPAQLRFAVGPLPEPPARTQAGRSQPVPKPTREQRERAAELAAEIDDEKLRKIVAKTAALSLSKADSDRRFW